ncbi:MAG TPA: hypothetical protein VGM77_01480 [Gemmatimonadales bacterium]
MRAIEALLASYLDLARHLDPLRYPEEAPPEIAHRVGRFDAGSLRSHVTALRSIANALEDLEDVEALDDEVDRTMLIDTIRTDSARIEASLTRDASNPALPLRHMSDALFALMGEDFDAESDAALRERVAAFPGFLASLREDPRPAPPLLLYAARLEANLFDESTLDMAAERLDDIAVQPALVAIAEHRHWLEDATREGGSYSLGLEAVEAQMATLASEPLGARGTLRLLELRRVGVERSLASAAEELGGGDPIALARQLQEESQPAPDMFMDYWTDEWRRVGDELGRLGLPVVDGDADDPPAVAEDGWSMAAYAVREHAARMLEEIKSGNPRATRRLLEAPGLYEGWGRTVAALLRSTDVFGQPERRLMMSFLALRDSVAAEVDLQLHAGMISIDDAMAKLQQTAGLSEPDAYALMCDITTDPLSFLGAAVAHEGWQAWYADAASEPVPFLLKAMLGGGLAVPVARWALEGAE